MEEKKIKNADFEAYGQYRVYYGSVDIPADIYRIFLKLNSRFKKINMIDVGAGDGTLVKNIYAKFKCGVSVSDIALVRLKRIKKQLGKNLKRIYLDDICQSKIPSNNFEFVNSDQVIEHVSSDKKMVFEIKRILKKKGLFRVSSVYKKKWAWYFYKCNNKRVLDPTHLREYTSIQSYKKIFIENGLKIHSIKLEKIYFPIIDVALRVLRVKNLSTPIIFLRKIKIRIPGYFNITIIGEK